MGTISFLFNSPVFTEAADDASIFGAAKRLRSLGAHKTDTIHYREDDTKDPRHTPQLETIVDSQSRG